MSVIMGLLAPWWQQIVGVLGILAGVGTVYFKGKSDANRKAKINDLDTANTIRKASAEARASVAADTAAGKLHQSDGWKRD